MDSLFPLLRTGLVANPIDERDNESLSSEETV